VRVYRAALSLSHEGSETGSGSGVGAETSLKVGSGSVSEKNHSGSATMAGFKVFKGKLVFVGILKATEEKSTT
jgi:hypothetical protein